MKKILMILLVLMTLGMLNAVTKVIFDTDVPLYDVDWVYSSWDGQPPTHDPYYFTQEIPPGITEFPFNIPHIWEIHFYYWDENKFPEIYRICEANLIENDEVVITIRGKMLISPDDPGTPIEK